MGVQSSTAGAGREKKKKKRGQVRGYSCEVWDYRLPHVCGVNTSSFVRGKRGVRARDVWMG